MVGQPLPALGGGALPSRGKAQAMSDCHSAKADERRVL